METSGFISLSGLIDQELTNQLKKTSLINIPC